MQVGYALARKRTKVGTVVSDRMDKTVVVAVGTSRRHPLYGRTVKETRKFKAHDGGNTCRAGDVVRIAEFRPLSREKRWIVVEVIRRREGIMPPEGEEEAAT